MGIDTGNLPCEFGKYHLIERIATGGMAELYRAKLYGAGGFEKDLAIKKVLPQLANDKGFIQMFMDEAMITVTLNHGNIVSVLDFGEIDDEYFLVMEYVDGVDLQSTIRRCTDDQQPIPVPVACMVSEHICRGLDYAHRKLGANGKPLQIVHRDVSPQNILLSFEGEVKIVDFGIARAASRITSTQAGVVKGKVAYMSPEQLTGHEVDNRSDIFAAGIILYEMLTNHRPFSGQTPQETMAAITRNGFEKPQKYNKKIEKKINPILRKALEKNPKKRYQTAGEMANALSAFLHRTGLHPDPTELVSFISKRMPDAHPRTVQPTPVRLIRRQTEEEMRAAQQARAETEQPPPEPPVAKQPTAAPSTPHAFPPAQAAPRQDVSGPDDSGQDAVVVNDGEAVTFDMLGLPSYERGAAAEPPGPEPVTSGDPEPEDSTRPTDPVRPATQSAAEAASQPDIHRATTQPLPQRNPPDEQPQQPPAGEELLRAETRLLAKSEPQPATDTSQDPGIYDAKTHLLPKEEEADQSDPALLSAATNLMLKQPEPALRKASAPEVPKEKAAPPEPVAPPEANVAAKSAAPATAPSPGEEEVEDAWMDGKQVPQGVAGTDSVKAAAFPSSKKGLKVAIGALGVAAVIVTGYLILRPTDKGQAADQATQDTQTTSDHQPSAASASPGTDSNPEAPGTPDPDEPGDSSTDEQQEPAATKTDAPPDPEPQQDTEEPPPGDQQPGEDTPAGEQATTDPTGDEADKPEPEKPPTAKQDEPANDKEKKPTRKPKKRRNKRKRKRRRRVAQTDPTPRPVPKRGNGTLRINAEPFAVVYLGKKRIGPTPQMNLKLPAGSHTLTLRNEALGLTRKVRVRIEPDKVHTIFVDLKEK